MLLSVLEETRLSCCRPVMGTVAQARRKREMRVKRNAAFFICITYLETLFGKPHVEHSTFTIQHRTGNGGPCSVMAAYII
jgi:hypothetical protein